MVGRPNNTTSKKRRRTRSLDDPIPKRNHTVKESEQEIKGDISTSLREDHHIGSPRKKPRRRSSSEGHHHQHSSNHCQRRNSSGADVDNNHGCDNGSSSNSMSTSQCSNSLCSSNSSAFITPLIACSADDPPALERTMSCPINQYFGKSLDTPGCLSYETLFDKQVCEPEEEEVQKEIQQETSSDDSYGLFNETYEYDLDESVSSLTDGSDTSDLLDAPMLTQRPGFPLDEMPTPLKMFETPRPELLLDDRSDYFGDFDQQEDTAFTIATFKKGIEFSFCTADLGISESGLNFTAPRTPGRI